MYKKGYIFNILCLVVIDIQSFSNKITGNLIGFGYLKMIRYIL